MMKNIHFFQLRKRKIKIKKLTINITFIYKNNNYYKSKIFIQINNYYELEKVLIKEY